MFDDTVLDLIDNISESCRDSEFEVFDALSNAYSKCALMMEYNNYEINDVLCIQEATNVGDNSGVNQTESNDGEARPKKTGILRSILDAIIRFFRFIGRQIARFVNFIKRLFTKKTKTADQIAEEVGVQPKGSASSNSKKSNNPPTPPKQPRKRKLVKSGRKRYTQKVDKSIGEVVKTVTVPLETVSENGTVVDQSIDVDLILKKVQVKLNQDGTFTMRPTEKEIVNGRIRTKLSGNWDVTQQKNSHKDIKSPHFSSVMSPFFALLCLIGDNGNYLNNLMQSVFDLFDELKYLAGIYPSNTDSDKGKKIIVFCNKISDQINNFPLAGWNDSDRYDYRTFIEIQKKISEFAVKLENMKETVLRVDNPAFYRNETLGNIVMKTLNSVTYTFNNIQMSFNTLTKLFNLSYDIDADYEGSVNDVETLGKFVEGCIKSGMPSKNIIINTYLISSPELRGEKIEMKNGQSRVVMFPDNEPGIVYKVALNGLGVASNKAERTIFTLAEKQQYNELVDYLIPTHRDSISNVIITQDRAQPTTREERVRVFLQIRNKVQDILNRTGFPYNIDDIHYDNIGKRAHDGNWVVIDYGMTGRR